MRGIAPLPRRIRTSRDGQRAEGRLKSDPVASNNRQVQHHNRGREDSNQSWSAYVVEPPHPGKRGLHQNGENWVLRHLLQANGEFPLWDKVTRYSRSRSSDKCTVYEAGEDADINFDALAYFAVSVIWKAAVFNWRRDGAGITLGEPYTDQCRTYLLGGAPFPENAVLIIDITRPENRLKKVLSDVATSRGEGCFRHWFMTPGVVFEICLGKLMRQELRRICGLRNRIIGSSNHEATFRAAYESMKPKGSMPVLPR